MCWALTVQGNDDVHRNATRHLSLSMHSLACLSPPSQPRPRDVAADHVSAAEAEAQRGQQPPSDKATMSPLRGSNRPGRTQGVRGRGEPSRSMKLSSGWCLQGMVTSSWLKEHDKGFAAQDTEGAAVPLVVLLLGCARSGILSSVTGYCCHHTRVTPAAFGEPGVRVGLWEGTGG